MHKNGQCSLARSLSFSLSIWLFLSLMSRAYLNKSFSSQYFKKLYRYIFSQGHLNQSLEGRYLNALLNSQE